MSLLNILQYPDNRLRKVAQHVHKVNNNIRNIIDDMFETMYAAKGIGLAATQVDIHQQIIVIDISEQHNQRLVLINPKIFKKSGKTGTIEGCLSIPNQHMFIKRAEKINVRSIDYNGNKFDITVTDLLAICIQHEIDHLVGKLFIDYC